MCRSKTHPIFPIITSVFSSLIKEISVVQLQQLCDELIDQLKNYFFNRKYVSFNAIRSENAVFSLSNVEISSFFLSYHKYQISNILNIYRSNNEWRGTFIENENNGYLQPCWHYRGMHLWQQRRVNKIMLWSVEHHAHNICPQMTWFVFSSCRCLLKLGVRHQPPPLPRRNRGTAGVQVRSLSLTLKLMTVSQIPAQPCCFQLMLPAAAPLLHRHSILSHVTPDHPPLCNWSSLSLPQQIQRSPPEGRLSLRPLLPPSRSAWPL